MSQVTFDRTCLTFQSHAFSPKALLEQEDIILEYADMFMVAIAEESSNGPVNLTDCYNWVTFDSKWSFGFYCMFLIQISSRGTCFRRALRLRESTETRQMDYDHLRYGVLYCLGLSNIPRIPNTGKDVGASHSTKNQTRCS
jgi:hypothetical protein